jgi:hypothetical protein
MEKETQIGRPLRIVTHSSTKVYPLGTACQIGTVWRPGSHLRRDIADPRLRRSMTHFFNSRPTCASTR